MTQLQLASCSDSQPTRKSGVLHSPRLK